MKIFKRKMNISVLVGLFNSATVCILLMLPVDDVELTERVTITRHFKDKVVQPILKVS